MPNFESYTERKKFYATNNEDETFPITFKRSMVIIKFPNWNTSVVFTKSNRGKYFHDSREPKKALTATEVYAELLRMLDSKEQADAAFANLQV